MTNQPRHDPQTELPDCQQAALKQRLQSAFPPAFPSDSDPEKTIQWLAANIDKGLCRVYAVHLNECLDEEGYKRLVERASRRIDDPQLMESLKEILAAPSQLEHPSPEPLVPLLADIAFQEIDHILQQAKTLGREDNFLHVQCTRVGNELIVLSDRDPRYDWIVPAVQKRLHDEMINLHYDPEIIETQSLDMTCGEPLRFLDFELRCVRKRSGDLRVQSRLVEESSRRYHAEKAPARPRRLGHYHPSRLLQPCLNWLEHWRSWRFLYGFYRKTNTMQAGWRHLPITLLPVLMFLFGWRSPAALLCLALIFACNWRWILSFVQNVFQGVYDKTNAMEVSWRYLPLTLSPILMFFFGWRSPVTWLSLALIFVCNWHWSLGLVRWSGRHKVDVGMAACALTALIFLYPFVSEIYANRPHEVAVSSALPPGFFLGEYHGDSWWSGEPTPGITYGLYLPPHFRAQKGPFPLIVFLHGYGERNDKRIFQSGLPRAIIKRIGPQGDKRRFEFIAFFPIDPTGRWQSGSAEVEGALRALDYVIGYHHIDPARIYLTGHSAGGSAVWGLAQADPHKWAAVAPLCSFISPDVQKVRHLPAWIFHGAKDKWAPVERERTLVQQLKEAEADVRYTEFPNKGHIIWREAYGSDAFYVWLTKKKKG